MRVKVRLLREFVQCVLTEGRIDDLKKKYPELSEKIDALASSVKQKYVEWAVKQLRLGHSINDIIPTLNFFDKNVSKFENRDINSYDLKSLENTVKSIGSKSSVSQDRKEAKISGAEKLYEDDNLLLLHIKSKEASVCYGSGTKWCITMKDANYWEEYTDNNVVFYFLIEKRTRPTDPMHKLALAWHRSADNTPTELEVFDAEDTQIDPYEVANDYMDFTKMMKISREDAKTRKSPIVYRLKQYSTASTITNEELTEIFSQDSTTTSEYEKMSDTKYVALKFMRRDGAPVDEWAKLCASDSNDLFRMNAVEKLHSINNNLIKYFYNDKRPEIRDMVIKWSSDAFVLEKAAIDVRNTDKRKMTAVLGLLEIYPASDEAFDALKKLFANEETWTPIRTLIAQQIDFDAVPEFIELTRDEQLLRILKSRKKFT